MLPMPQRRPGSVHRYAHRAFVATTRSPFGRREAQFVCGGAQDIWFTTTTTNWEPLGHG
jgi:hypothetical protein